MTSRQRPDALGIVGYLAYAIVGGLLVFGFAWSLRSAVRVQNESICRALEPELRSGEAPDFEVQDLVGNAVNLSDFRGKFVVLNFWATWCEPCVTEWPQLHQLAERFADTEDVVILALSQDKERDKVEPFLDLMGLGETKVRVLWDPKQDVGERFGTSKMPDTYFIDEQGELVRAFINTRKWGAPEAYHCVEGTRD